MVQAIKPVIEEEYICRSDCESASPTTFKIKALNGLEFLDAVSGYEVDYVKLIEHGLIGWDNFNDESGKPISFNKITKAQVPPLVLREIAEKIYGISELMEPERKNSE